MKRVMRFWNLNGPRGHIENEDCPKPDKCIPTGEYVLTKDEMKALWHRGYVAGSWDDESDWDIWKKEHGVI